MRRFIGKVKGKTNEMEDAASWGHPKFQPSRQEREGLLEAKEGQQFTHQARGGILEAEAGGLLLSLRQMSYT